jgi:hypothetical protein
VVAVYLEGEKTRESPTPVGAPKQQAGSGSPRLDDSWITVKSTLTPG